MNNYVAIGLALLLTVILGSTFFMGDKDSVKSSISKIMTNTTTEIEDVSNAN